jgi:hypothetical protein
MSKKTVRPLNWWYGWVKYTFVDFNGDKREGVMTTTLDFSTAGQAQRAADAIAGAMMRPMPVGKWERRHSSKNDQWHTRQRFVVLETGADRADGG